MGQQNHTRSAPKEVRVRVSSTGPWCLLIMSPLRSASGRRQSSSTCQKRAVLPMPGPDHHFSPREPSTRWPSRASSSTSRTAQFSTRSLVMTRQLAENRPHLGPSASRCAPKVYFSVPLVPYLRRKRTSEREDPTAQTRRHAGILPQEGAEPLFANRRNHRHQFFHQVYGAGEVGAPRRSRGLLEIGFFVSAAGRGIWGSGAHPGAAGRSQPHANRTPTQPVVPPSAPCLRLAYQPLCGLFVFAYLTDCRYALNLCAFNPMVAGSIPARLTVQEPRSGGVLLFWMAVLYIMYIMYNTGHHINSPPEQVIPQC